uniref:Uncharacterized protein n=1 Tax=Anguilla anguilla TaxID=7936 RepID=A0A0E9V606_ANGAN
MRYQSAKGKLTPS